MKQKKTALASATAKQEDPDAWVSAKPKPEPNPETEKPARLVVELPADLHRKLKGKCGLKGLKMKDVINELLQEWVKT
jgi:hypothetical protein